MDAVGMSGAASGSGTYISTPLSATTRLPAGRSSEEKCSDVPAEEQTQKRPKRRVAIIFGYIGERYCGLQWNHLPNYPTVEEELLRALHLTDMISKENYAQERVQQKLNWERASRTDKGVHALRNVISVNIMLPYAKGSTTEYDTEEAKRRLMTVLPHDILVYEIVPVTRSFNAYLLCGARTYEYYLPTFALMDLEEYSHVYFPVSLAPSRPTLEEVGLPGVRSASRKSTVGGTETRVSLGEKRSRDDGVDADEEDKDKDREVTGENDTNGTIKRKLVCEAHGNKIEEERKEGTEKEQDQHQDNQGVDGNETVRKFHDGLFEKLLVFRSIPEDAMRHISQYRLSPEKLEHARSIFRLFEGTNSYHNFTPGGRASDPSSMRYITSVTVGDPFIIDPTDDAVVSTLSLWTPSRCYFPDDEGFSLEEEKDVANVEQMREKMRDHMMRVYGGKSSKEETTSNEKRGLEVVRIELHGQSFMLNQIRKMIGAVISICSAGLPPAYLRYHMLNKNVRCGIPMAPANGLFLSYLDFQRYNYRLDRIQSQGKNGRGKEGVYVDSVDKDALEEFRRRIVAVVIRNEMVGDLMGRWMRSLRHVLRLACNIELP